MSEPSTPRATIRQVIRGEPAARPLLVPVIFALGSRLENVSFREYLLNPTKIANALRQILAKFMLDGVAVYFDPLLEAEILGCGREWRDERSCDPVGPFLSNVGELREKIAEISDISNRKPLATACDVLQRLKTMLNKEAAFLVRITGPVSLATQLLGSEAASEEAAECAVEVTSAVTRALLEAGANVVQVVEPELFRIPQARYGWWASLVAPVINLVQFYEALPLIRSGAPGSTEHTLASALTESWSGTWSPVIADDSDRWAAWALHGVRPSLAMDAELKQRAAGVDIETRITELLGREAPLVLTTQEDVDADADVKVLATWLGKVREAAWASARV